jgi:hypothetical protein
MWEFFRDALKSRIIMVKYYTVDTKGYQIESNQIVGRELDLLIHSKSFPTSQALPNFIANHKAVYSKPCHMVSLTPAN